MINNFEKYTSIVIFRVIRKRLESSLYQEAVDFSNGVVKGRLFRLGVGVLLPLGALGFALQVPGEAEKTIHIGSHAEELQDST